MYIMYYYNTLYSMLLCNYVYYVFLLYSLEKDVTKRPKYDDLLKQPFILSSEAEDTDIGVWYTVLETVY